MTGVNIQKQTVFREHRQGDDYVRTQGAGGASSRGEASEETKPATVPQAWDLRPPETVRKLNSVVYAPAVCGIIQPILLCNDNLSVAIREIDRTDKRE